MKKGKRNNGKSLGLSVCYGMLGGMFVGNYILDNMEYGIAMGMFLGIIIYLLIE